MTPDQREAALRLELASEPLVKPVAWLCKHLPENGGGGFITCDEVAAAHYMHKFRTAENATVLVPLYAHPQQRKPLTDEQVYEALSDQVFWATSKNFILRLVRDVERAHGIGEAP